jgi:hypothetical protein
LSSLSTLHESPGDILPIEPEEKSEQPDNERRENEEKKLSEPTRFASLLGHIALIVAVEPVESHSPVLALLSFSRRQGEGAWINLTMTTL